LHSPLCPLLLSFPHVLILKTMKYLFFLLFALCSFVFTQTPVFSDFVTGAAQVKNGQVEFYLQNTSTCVLEQIQVRVASDQTYNSVTATTFITQLQPSTQGTFVVRPTQPIGAGWAWTIDTLTLGQPENPTCPQPGLVTFEKVDFASSAQATVAAPAPQAEITRAVTRDYTVVAGDSWWKIAQRFGSTPEAIAAMNGRNTDTLSVGEILKVPAPTLEAEATSGSIALGGAPTTEGTGELTSYTVKAGDTLFGIARVFDTTVALIRQANCLGEEDVLSVNQKLLVPPKDAVLTSVCN
jgi:LysM repeat protein